MGKLKNNQSGFSAVEVIVVIVIVALIGTVGWLVYKNHHKTTTAAVTTTAKATTTKPATTTKTTTTTPVNLYTSSDKVFSVTYPTGWVSDGPSGPCGLITCVGQVDFSLNSSSDSPDINILEAKSTLSPTDWFAQNEGPTSEDTTNTTSINGYSTYYNQSGSSPQSLMTDSYVMSNNGYVVDISMRVIYVDTNAGINDNFTQYMPQLTKTVDSIKFNN